MKLTDIHLNYKTDKGTGHNYIQVYEDMFSSLRENEMNVLEIGVLLGGSHKMWNDYFVNSTIYGVDIFTREESNPDLNWEKVNNSEVMDELINYGRIKLIQCDSSSENQVKNKIGSLNIEFDIIIDDGNHDPNCQINTFNNFLPYLTSDGVYVVEDLQGMRSAEYVKNYIDDTYDGLQTEIIALNTQEREDDILVVIK